MSILFEQETMSVEAAKKGKYNSTTEKVTSGDKLVEVTEENIEELIVTATMDWVNMIAPEKDLCVGDIIEVIVDGSDEIQYMASVFDKTIPYGYVTVGFKNNEVVVMEANINKGQEGMYTELVEDVVEDTNLKRKDLDIEKKVVELAPMQYAVEYKDKKGNKKVLDNYGEVMDADELKYGSDSYNSILSIYIWNNIWNMDKYKISEKIILEKYKSNNLLVTSKKVKELTGRYACGVQALLQIAYMDKLTSFNDTDIKKFYNKLWTYTKTIETEESKKDTDDNIIYGEGNIENAANGYIKYAKEKGYKNSEFKGVEKNPSVAWIKNKLKYNRPILMGYGIKVKDEKGKVDRAGHFISILGYLRAQKGGSGKAYNYFMVYNGWFDQISYINYTTVDFMDCSATYFWTKK